MLGYCKLGQYWVTPPIDRSCCYVAPNPVSTSLVKKYIVVETIDKDNDNHINKLVCHSFGGPDVFSGTILGVQQVKDKPLWEIQFFNDKDVYDYNLSEVLDG